jgi:cytochrome P450
MFCCLQTTAHTVCWTLFLLATHPEAEARLCAELDSLGLLASPNKPRPALLQWEHLSQVSHTALLTTIGDHSPYQASSCGQHDTLLVGYMSA